MIVHKFGGASVKNADAVRNVAKIVKSIDSEAVIVVSAMGKKTVALEKLAHAFFNRSGQTTEIFKQIKEYHITIIRELFPVNTHLVYKSLNDLFEQLAEWLHREPSMNYDFEYDQVVSFGELFSTTIVSAYLTEYGIANTWKNMCSLLKTDDTYREAKIDWQLSARLLTKELNFTGTKIYVVQGFIGATKNNTRTTLGLEGSDFTASIVACILNAEKTVIWKDVEGIYTADPKEFANPVKLKEISYKEAVELAYYGAKVLHPKTIKPAENKHIPLIIKSFFNPEKEGTIIHSVTKQLDIPPVYITKRDQILISILPDDFSFIAEENLGKLFLLLSKYRIKVNLMQNSAISFSVCVDDYPSKVQPFINDVKKEFKVLFNKNLDLITIRHYTEEAIWRMTGNRQKFAEQKTRLTARYVVK